MDQHRHQQQQHERPAELSRGVSSPGLPTHLDHSAVNPAPVNPANPVLRSIALADAVTPGIHQHTYVSGDSSRSQSPSYFPRGAEGPSYFSLSDRRRDPPPPSQSQSQSQSPSHPHQQPPHVSFAPHPTSAPSPAVDTASRHLPQSPGPSPAAISSSA
ncbi:glycosyltransferase family 20 protein [Colletotrichum tofieldiae]|nr:glycosyltransferase family 20 protein [Colletotrichum tofieldiae]